jgi:hypothetical protein
MADHSKPLSTSTYANFVSELDARFDDLALGLDTTATNLPTNAIRYSSANAKWQKWNGSVWSDLAATYAINVSGNAGTVTNGVVTTGSYSDPTWLTSLAGTKISGAISGNAGSATILATARTINGVSFNGSANISLNLNTSLTFNNGGSGSASGVTFNGGTATTISYNSVGAPSATGAGASGTWSINVSGNAGTATSATTATNLSGGTVSATSIVSSGDITAFSDERLKQNWRDLPADFVERLAEVKMGIYDRKDTGETQAGVSAQSLQSTLPSVVNENADGILSVAYGNAALASCVALAREVTILKAELAALKG